MALVLKNNSELTPSYLRYAEEREYAGIREKSHLPLWLVLSGFSLGLCALWSKESYLLPIFMTVAYSGILVAFGTTVVASRDIFNPLCFVLLIGIIRYSCPAFLLRVGIEPPEDIAQFYRLMRLSDSDWPWAHVLALTSLAGIVLGWFVMQGGASKPSQLNFSFSAGISHAALFGMLVGGAALVVFIVKKASLAAIVTGAIRNATIQEGTGVYFRFIYMAIAGSILLSAYLLERNKRRIALIPVLACTLVLLTLGGRGRAITPLAAGLLLQWYRNRERNGWPVLHIKIKYIITGILVFLLATWLFHFVALYRGGHGLSAFGQSLSLQGIWEYLQYSIFVEFGHLHSLAGAVVIGPGVLGGQTFLGSLTFPLSKLLPIPGRSAGVYIVETLVGFSTEDRWGLHASLIGDAYLNFGVIGIMLIMPLFGMLMKLLYSKFRRGTLNAALYAFATVYGLNLFLKSIEAWPHMLVGLVFMLVITRLSVLFNFRQRVFG
jgi:oligosaccharide repeat unit polymerase